MTLERLFLRGALLLATTLAFSATSFARDLRVPSDYSTIQAAINAARPGDRILVSAGIYRGSGNANLDFYGKAITLSGAGWRSTILDGEGENRGIIFHSGETASSVVRSLTFRNCSDSIGAAVAIQNSSPLLSQCAIENCRANSGGAVYIGGGTPRFSKVSFTRNHAILGGGAVYSDQGSPIFEQCSFQSNATRAMGGAANMHGGAPSFLGCSFGDGASDFGGAALSLFGTQGSLINCSFTQNVALQNGGALDLRESSQVQIVNCTFAANLSHRGAGAIYASGDSHAQVRNSILWSNPSTPLMGDIEVSYSCIEGGRPGQGNTDDDPMLVDAMGQDLHLVLGSPCIDTAGPLDLKINGDLEGRPRRLGSAVDMGAYEFPILRPTAVSRESNRTTFMILHDGNPETNTAVVTLRASGYDQLLGALAYQWTLENEVVSSAQTAAVSLEAGTQEVLLETRDSSGQVAQQTIYVTVLPEQNAAPTCSAGNRQGVTTTSGESKVTLHGRGQDADGDPLTYLWSTGATTEDVALSLRPGEYDFTLTVTDPYGAKSSSSTHVSVRDGGGPTVTLNGESTMVVEAASTWTDPGATAYDDVDGKLAVAVSGKVDTTHVGAYTLVYSATDSSGNTGKATRTVTVADTVAPVITLMGANPMTVNCGSGYVEPGATAADAVDGGVSVTITGTVSSATGDYSVTYTAMDRSGNTTQAVRTVHVARGGTPVITLNGAGSMTVECGTGYSEPGATATDACGDSLSVSISGSIPSAKGTYTVTYRATSASGEATIKTRTVIVSDTRAPVITLNGSGSVTVDLASGTYSEQGATATDACDGSVAVVISGSVPAAVGTYTVTYRAVDASGNSASATRTVTVISSAGPSISGLTASPSVLNSQNQRMRTITLTYTVTSPSDPSPTISVTCVSSDADTGVFTGDLGGDIVVLNTTSLSVREEHAPNRTRTYTITVRVTDRNGRTASATVTVRCQ